MLTIAFGRFIVSSLIGLTDFFTGDLSSDPLATDPDDLNAILLYELCASALIAVILGLRGWRIRQFNITFSLYTSLAGLGLMLVDIALYTVSVGWIFIPLFPDSAALYSESPVPTLGVTSVIVFSVVNGCFEELFVVGYVYLTLAARYSMGVAMFISLSIRLLYHLYQGPIAIVTIIPMGLLFFYLYARYRRLWPLMFAHGLLDMYGLWDEICFADTC